MPYVLEDIGMKCTMRTVEIGKGTLGTTTLLQKGVCVPGASGASVGEFLEQSLGLSPEYIDTDVRTIFLNCSPVDDIDGVHVKDGDVLSLSAAMPGLVGIAMGRNTAVSGFRSDISAKDSGEVPEGDALVTVKLFNLVAQDAGPAILARGVVVSADALKSALGDAAPDVQPDEESVILRVV